MINRLFRSLNLTALLLLTLLPGGVALMFMGYQTYQAERAAADQDLASRVRAMSQIIDRDLLAVQHGLELLAVTSPELRGGDLQRFHAQMMRALQALPLADVLQLYAPDGQILLSTREPYGARLPRSATSARIEGVVQTGLPAIGDVITGTVTQQVLIPVDVPVHLDGKVVYVLTAGLFSDHFNQLLNRQVYPEGWISVVYDRTGTITARTLHSDQFLGKKVAPVLLDWLTGPAERLGEGKTLEGRPSVAAMYRSQQTGYSVTASVPTAVLTGPMRRVLLLNMTAGAISLVLGVVLIWRFAQGVRRSLSDLERATQAVAAGQPFAALPLDGSADLVRLAERFNTMQQALQEARAAQERYQRALEFSATHDPLTGLANRVLLNDRITQAIAAAARAESKVAVMLLDLDHFKRVNDTLSHAAGDVLLVEMARRMRDVVREADTIGRLGGDEFLVVLGDVSSPEDVVRVAEKLLQDLAAPLVVSNQALNVSASLGIALAPQDGLQASELIRNADVAMYRAKESGRNRYQFFESGMNALLQERLQMEAGLRQALARREFVLHYQPRCELATGRILGAEALIRWQHPERGLLGPGLFIPLAEETGLITAIGAWVMQTACVQARRWQALCNWPLHVSVNVSARQFQSGHLTQEVNRSIGDAGLPPALLELELTESDVMRDPVRTLQTLRELKAIGVQIALDDFGTGYSSLSYLKRFPIDCLKIDQSFVRDIAEDPEDAAIARMVVTLGHSLRQSVVAEGVETSEQLEFLRAQGCDQVQGYLFSKPVPPEQFEALLRAGRPLGPG